MAQAVIAIVDDDPSMLATTSAILREEGYQVLLWSEGKTAYDFVRDHDPDLLILDLRMEHPHAGWLIIHMLRLDPQTAAIPVLMCTGDTEYVRRERRKLREQQCEVLLKPFSADEILDKVARLLEPKPADAASPGADKRGVGQRAAAGWARSKLMTWIVSLRHR